MCEEQITIYWGSGSGPCWRALICLEEKGLKYESKQISFSEKGHKSPEIMALNPRGQVPTFKHGDIVVNESLAICHYLEEEFKNKGTRLIPENRSDRALVMQRMFECINWERKVSELYYNIMRSTPEELKAKEADLKEKIKDEIAYWEGYFSKAHGKYLGGNEFSMADAVFFPMVAFAHRIGLSFDTRPHLKAYYDLVMKRPSVMATWPPHWKDSDGKSHLAGL